MGLRLTIPPREEIPPVSDPTSRIEYLNQRVETLAAEVEALCTDNLGNGFCETPRPRAVSLPPDLVRTPMDLLPLSAPGRQEQPTHETNNTFAEALQAQIRQMSAEVSHTMQMQNAVLEEMNARQTIIAYPVMTTTGIIPDSAEFDMGVRDTTTGLHTPTTPLYRAEHGVIEDPFGYPSRPRINFPAGMTQPSTGGDERIQEAQFSNARGRRWYTSSHMRSLNHTPRVQDSAYHSRIPTPIRRTPRPTRRLPLLRYTTHDNMEVKYVYRYSHTERTLAVIDWGCLVLHGRFASIENASQALRGAIRVYVENCIGIVDMAQLVQYELRQACHHWILSDEEAQEWWSTWCGIREERMEYTLPDSPIEECRCGHRH